MGPLRGLLFRDFTSSAVRVLAHQCASTRAAGAASGKTAADPGAPVCKHQTYKGYALVYILTGGVLCVKCDYVTNLMCPLALARQRASAVRGLLVM